VEGLTPGFYWFAAGRHQLVQLEVDSASAERMTKACFEQEMPRRCAVTFIWIADVYRSTWRYSERGYRYLFLDAGHVCQNLYLAAESIDCGACAIGAFLDEEMNGLLELDGKNQFVIYLAAVGKKV
jgi:SagB-type dehydrogenase family enzyme